MLISTVISLMKLTVPGVDLRLFYNLQFYQLSAFVFKLI